MLRIGFSPRITGIISGIQTIIGAQRALSHQNISSHREIFPGFKFWPSFFSVDEQKCLLHVALKKLDSMESRRFRQRKEKYLKDANETRSINQMFCPDDCYEFQEGHFDGVIHRYRETLLSSWPEADALPGLAPTLQRLYSLCPTPNVQTHLLHLASDGEIYPHIDNISASGVWILGASFGDERILTLDNGSANYEIALPSGSVYLQSDHIRYTFRHSIKRSTNGENNATRQRLSIMVRDLPSYPVNLSSTS